MRCTPIKLQTNFSSRIIAVWQQAEWTDWKKKSLLSRPSTWYQLANLWSCKYQLPRFSEPCQYTPTHSMAVTWWQIQSCNDINLSKPVNAAFFLQVTLASRDSTRRMMPCKTVRFIVLIALTYIQYTHTHSLTLRHMAPLLQILHALKKTYMSYSMLSGKNGEAWSEREEQPHCFQHNNVIPPCKETLTGSV